MTQRRIVVFSKPDDFRPKCYPCQWTKQWLEERDIDAEIKDATLPENLEYLLANTDIKSAPAVLVYDGETIVDSWGGFNPNKLEELLAA